MRPDPETNMKVRICILLVSLLAAASARSAPAGYAYCGSYASYVLLYRSVEQLEEMGHLRCGEKVELLAQHLDYFQVRALDGRVGWVNRAGISIPPGAAPTTNVGATDASAPHAPAVPPLTNTDILKMHATRLSSDVIAAKIHASLCVFDTSPAALQKLKQAGVPDKVILAMVQALAASAPPVAKGPEITEVKVPAGTPIEVELSINISSDTTQDAMIVPMTVAQDVVVNGVTVFRQGAEARAQVTTMRQPGFMNRPPGEISWTMEYVIAVTGDHIPATFFSKDAGASPISSIMGAVGPTWEFRKGKPVVITAGKRFDAVVHGAAVVKIPQSVVAAQASTSSSTQPPARAVPAATTKP